MSFNTTLRPATADDSEQVADVYLASRRAFLPFAPIAHPEGDVRTWISSRLIPRGGVVVVADIAKGVVAIMAISRRDGVGWLDLLYVHPSFVGHGLGSRLLAHARAALGSPIRLYTFQANEDARRFYERHGFRAVLFGDGSGNEERCPDVLYEWSDDDRTRPRVNRQSSNRQ